MSDVDIEKAPISEKGPSEVVTSQPDFAHSTIVEIDPTVNHIHGTDWLSKKLKKIDVNVEDRGMERVPPDDRTHTKTFDLMLLWGSANVAITNFSVGLIGTPYLWTRTHRHLSCNLLFRRLSNLFCLLPFNLWAKDRFTSNDGISIQLWMVREQSYGNPSMSLLRRMVGCKCVYRWTNSA